MRTILSFICAGLLPLLALAGCGDDEASGGRVSVVATTPQAAEFAREVGGGRVDVTQVLAANADPHEYEPQPSDAEALIDADLVIRSGGDLDEWLDQLIDSSGTDAPALTLMDSVHTRSEDGEDDPHWWQDPRNAVLAVAAIRDELGELDPDGRGAYARNADAYSRELRALDAAIATCLRSVPADRRKLVTSHDALGYFADRYGIEVTGATIPSLSTQAQPSAGETAKLVDLIRRSGVSTIFPEAGVSPDLEQSIASQAGASIGGELWADTLGPEGSDAATYIGAMESNANELVNGFTGGSGACRFGRLGASRAVGAVAAQHDVVTGDSVVEAVAEVVDRALELRVLERRHLATAIADQMVMVVLAARQGRLEAGRAVADVESLEQAHPLEQLEGPVDRRDADLAAIPPQLVGDLAGAEHARLARDRLEHGGARRARPVTRLAQAGFGRGDPCPRVGTRRV